MSFTKTHILPLLIIALSTTAFAAPAKPDYSETDSIRINKHSFSPEKTNLADSVINFGKLFLNTPYRYGSAGTNSFDCSGFTSHVYKNFGVDLERSSYDQSTQFPVVEKHEIKPGDLVFYEGRRRNGRVGHVGIVTEIKDNGEFDFIHASVNRGVIITNSAEDYYSKRFVRAGRVMENDSILKVMSLSNLNRAEYVSKNPSQSVKKVIPAKYHYVKKGETLSGIASKYGMTVAQLKRKNGLKKDMLQLKQRLLIKDEEVVMVVQPVLASNKTAADSTLVNSENKQVAESGEVCESVTKHVVQRGETLYSISQKYGMTVVELQKLNKLGKSKIFPGQTLVLSEEQPEVAEQPTKTETKPVAAETKTEKPVVAVAQPIREQPKVEEKRQEVQSKVAEPVIAKNEIQQPKENKEKAPVVNNKKESVNKFPGQIKEEVHIVRSGESLLSISRKYNTSIDELKSLNGLSGNVVEIGQMLVIHTNDPNYVPKPKPAVQHVEEVQPAEQKEIAQQTEVKPAKNLKQEKPVEKEPTEEPEVTNVKAETHKVQRGESLYSIAKMYNMTVDELKELNDMTGSSLQAGQKLKVNADEGGNVAAKKPAAKKETTITHKVKSGENYTTIAKRYGCKVSDVKKWNNRTSDKLDVGDKLVIRKK